MRFNGGEALPWSRVERILSGRPGPIPVPVNHLPGAAEEPEAGHSAVPFAELHAVSSYSFLHGAPSRRSWWRAPSSWACGGLHW